MHPSIHRTRVVGFAAALAAFGNALPQAQADELFAADRATSRVIAFDAATGAFTREIVSEGLLLPSSLAIGNGSLFVGDATSGQVLQVNLTTLAASVFTTINGVGGLAYDQGADLEDPADDSLFVSEFGERDGDTVFRYNLSGTLLNTIGTGSGNTGRAGLAIRNGDLYVSKFGEGPASFGSVLRYTAASNFTTATTVASDVDTLQTANPTLNGANGLAFDAAGKLYVAGLGSQNVMQFDISSGPDASGTPVGLPFFVYPSGILIEEENSDEVMYVTSIGNDNPQDPIYGAFLLPGAIYKFDVATGQLIPGFDGNPAYISSGGASDHNNDGTVNSQDLQVWRHDFGSTGATVADADNDDDDDGADFLIWQRNVEKLGDFQPTAVVLYRTPMDVAAVPEPSTWGLLAALGLAAGWHALRYSEGRGGAAMTTPFGYSGRATRARRR